MTAGVVTAVLLCAVLGSGVRGQATIQQAEDGSSGSLKFSTPTLSDEDTHSPFMPTQLKCDGCRVVSYKLFKAFSKATEKLPKSKTSLKESDILDVVESVCTGEKTFESYGIKEIKGEKRISGEGLETADVPGIMQGGGKWPSRLMEICNRFVDEIEEEPLYEAFKQNSASVRKFEKWLCHGSGIRNMCVKDAKPPKQEL